MGTGPIWPFPLACSFFPLINRVCKGYISQRHVCLLKELKPSLHCLDSAEDHLLAHSTSYLNVRSAFGRFLPHLGPNPWDKEPYLALLLLALLLPALHFCLLSTCLGPSSCNKPQVLQTLN